MKMRLSASVLLLAIVLLNSCHMQKLMVDVYTPPRVELPPDVRGILVTSRYVPATGEYEAVQWGYFEDVDSAMWDLSRYYAESFSRALDSSERYISRVDFDLRMLRHNDITMPEPLPWNGLQAIVEKYNAASIAVMQGFKIDEGDVVVNEVSGDSGTSYLASREINVSSAWRLSQPVRRRLLDENTYSYTKEFKAAGMSRDKAIAALPERDSMLKEACEWAAVQYSRVITPGTELVERDYYKDGDIKLVEAHEALQEGNWKTARSKWEYLAYEADNDEIKARACYNMAMFCEKDGRLNQALGFARKANSYVPHRRHLRLINELNIKMFREEERRERKEVIRNW